MKTTVIIFVILTIIMLAMQVYKPLQIKKISNNLGAINLDGVR